MLQGAFVSLLQFPDAERRPDEAEIAAGPGTAACAAMTCGFRAIMCTDAFHGMRTGVWVSS